MLNRSECNLLNESNFRPSISELQLDFGRDVIPVSLLIVVNHLIKVDNLEVVCGRYGLKGVHHLPDLVVFEREQLGFQLACQKHFSAF
ncbi:hypothetical protein D3C77_695740 [compost metagenome]